MINLGFVDAAYCIEDFYDLYNVESVTWVFFIVHFYACSCIRGETMAVVLSGKITANGLGGIKWIVRLR